jgi:TatD DNase family protein
MITAGWTDTHAHLADERLQSKLPSLLSESMVYGVRRILCVAVDADSLDTIDGVYREWEQFEAAKPQIFQSVGIHPNYAQQEKPGDWEKICEKVSDSRVAALGETGLDKHWDDCPFEVQLANFRRHWVLSRQTGLPVIIHSRECDEPMLELLREEYRNGPLKGVMHSFCSSYEVATECIAMGLYISFSGMLTYKKNDSLRQTASRLPIDRLLVETDAPYLSPEPKRSARCNEPAFVAYTGRVLAGLHGQSESQMADATTSNALRLFERMGAVA